MRRLLAILVLFLPAALARADVVELSGGTRLEGDVLEQGEKGVRVLLPAGDEVFVAKTDVKSVAVEPDAPGDGHFTRYTKEGARPGLQTGLVHFEKAGAPRVDLVGVVHVADASYYAEIQRVLDRADVVLYELVRDPEEKGDAKRPPPTDDPALKNLEVLKRFQTTLGNLLDLSFQMDGIDYRRKHFVHADMTMKEFMAQGGAEFSKEIAQQMAAFAPYLDRISKMLDGSTEESKKAVAMVRTMMKPLLGNMLGNMGDKGGLVLGGADFSELIVKKRNEVCMTCFDKVLADSQGAKSIAIFYGSAHMPDFEKRLLDRGWAKRGGRWLTAWDIRAKPAPTTKPAEPVKPEPPKRAEPEPAPVPVPAMD